MFIQCIMSVNIYGSSADATNETNAISTASAYTSFTVADGSSLLGTLYTSTLWSFAITGTDSAFVSVEYNSGIGTDVKLLVNDGVGANALWKNKSKYDFNWYHGKREFEFNNKVYSFKTVGCNILDLIIKCNTDYFLFLEHDWMFTKNINVNNLLNILELNKLS